MISPRQLEKLFQDETLRSIIVGAFTEMRGASDRDEVFEGLVKMKNRCKIDSRLNGFGENVMHLADRVIEGTLSDKAVVQFISELAEHFNMKKVSVIDPNY